MQERFQHYLTYNEETNLPLSFISLFLFICFDVCLFYFIYLFIIFFFGIN